MTDAERQATSAPFGGFQVLCLPFPSCLFFPRHATSDSSISNPGRLIRRLTLSGAMPSPPMPFDSDVTGVLSLARSVARDFSRAPDVFIPGEIATNALIAELESYQSIYTSPQGYETSLYESSLTAHLLPCRQALKVMSEIRAKYPIDRFGFGDSFKWNLDKSRFEKGTEALRQATTQLRETVQAVKQAQNVAQLQPRTESKSRGPRYQVPTQITLVHETMVSAQESTSYVPQASASQNAAPAPAAQRELPMCPNGPGCRQPNCGLTNSHPWAPSCEDGRNCCVKGCQKFHPKTAHCPRGPGCPDMYSGCTKAHPWPRSTPGPGSGSQNPPTVLPQLAQTPPRPYGPRGNVGAAASSSVATRTVVTGMFSSCLMIVRNPSLTRRSDPRSERAQHLVWE